MNAIADNPARRRRTSRGWPRLAWGVIVAAVAMLMFLQAATVPDQPDAAVGPRPDVLITGRIAVAIDRVLATDASSDAVQRSASTLAGLRQQATTDPDRLAVIVLEAELDSPGAALARLEALGPVTQGAAADDRDALETLYRSGVDGLTVEQRAGLIERQGWFGRLALSHELPSDDPQRRRVIGEAVRALATVTAVAAGVGLGLLAGLVLLIIAIVGYATGRLRTHYRPVRQPHTAIFLETVALFLVGMIGLSLAAGQVHRALGLPVAPLVPLLLMLVIFWPLARGLGVRRWRSGMGLERGRGLMREVAAGLVGYIAGLPILAAGLGLTILVIRWTGLSPEHPAQRELLDPEPWVAIGVVLLAAVWAPLVEELIFRGAFYHHVRRRWSCLVAGLVVGFVFAAIHPQGIAGIPVLMSIALVLALIREWRSSIVGSIAAHCLHNSMITLVLVMVVW
ncbi:MAG: type II CAAX endopeptidase family protein [Phycisphaeraceae bacterium]